jgi:hypothetical protein
MKPRGYLSLFPHRLSMINMIGAGIGFEQENESAQPDGFDEYAVAYGD